MKRLFLLVLLVACSQPDTQQPIIVDHQEPAKVIEPPDPGFFDMYLNQSYPKLAATYKVDAPIIGVLDSEVTIIKKNNVEKYMFNEFEYMPSSGQMCSGEICRDLRPESDPDRQLLALIRVFSLNTEQPSGWEYKGNRTVGDRVCYRYLAKGIKFEYACPDPMLDICIDDETKFPLYATVICENVPVVIWTATTATTIVESSMFE